MPARPSSSTATASRAAFASIRRSLASNAFLLSVATADRLKAWLEAPQRDVIDDPHRRKAVRTARQVGKTTTAVAYLLDVCLRKKDAIVVGIELTLKTAKQLLWKPLKRLCREYGIKAQFHNTDLIATFPATGATCIVGGAETEADVEKYRGLTLDAALIDEAKSFPARLLDNLIAEVIEPALLHRKGTLLLMGTPGNVLAGTFFETTGPEALRPMQIGDERRAVSRPYRERRSPKWRGVKFEWSFHTWTFDELKGKWALEAAREVEKLCAAKGYSKDNPIRRREYGGEWTPDDAKGVYKFDSTLNTWTPGEKTAANPFGLPEGHGWRYLVGCDLGWRDPFAVQVAAFSDTHPGLFQCWGKELTELKVSAQAALLQQAVDLCGGLEMVDAIVGDFDGGASKAIQETLDEEYGLPVEMAEKRQKRDHIELLNSDFLEKRAWVMKGSQLAEEMPLLQWDEKRPDKEKSSLKNNNCDAFLYLWRRARHHDAKTPTPEPSPTSPEGREKRKQAAIAHFHQQEKKRRAVSEDDTDGDGSWTPEGIDEW